MYMFIMRILVLHDCVLFHFYVFDPSIEKITTKMPKLSSSASLTSNSREFKSYSMLSRRDSFSSCSNDSSVYSGNNPRTRFRSAKPTFNHQANIRKRSRNSSGSSISSNVSGISDKNLKSSEIVSQASNKLEMNNCIGNDAQTPLLNHSGVNSTNRKETNVKEKLDGSKSSHILLPKQHNLRGKITKKECACCPSTHTTVVLRHYKKFIKTEEKTVISSTESEGKTVISRTSVKTYVENSSSDASENDKQANMSSNSSKTRKRRSEIEKLYASLHEIEWAKNFSPDNILRQINVRQAASCSAFGRSACNTVDLSENISKKHKLSNATDNSACMESSEFVKSKTYSNHTESSSCENFSNVNKETCTSNCDDGDNEQIADLQTAEMTTSDMYHCKQKYNPCSPRSSVNITSCSVSHIVKEINVNPTESVHTESFVTENGTDYSDDAQLSYTSDESSSAVSSSIVNLQSKHLLDLNYKKRNGNFSDTDLSEYSTPTFFDIAEEGIRTIDACFREVGAEVVVSSCCGENSLPLLTSVRETKARIKMLDHPPILEPCVNVKFNSNNKINNQIKTNTKSAMKSCSISPNLSRTKQFNSQDSNGIKKISRKIVKKYMRQLKKCLPRHKTNVLVNNRNAKLLSKSGQHFKINKCSKVKENKSDKSISQNSVLLSSVTSKEDTEISNELHDRCSTNKAKDRIVLDPVKNGSYFCDTRKNLRSSSFDKPPVLRTSRNKQHQSKSISSNVSEVKTQNEPKKHSIVLRIKNNKSRSVPPIFSAQVKALNKPRKQSTVLKSKKQPRSRSVSLIVRNNNIDDEESISDDDELISRPALCSSDTPSYNSIKVNKSLNYTQIILVVTRGKSMFLTLETLRELRDVVFRAKSDNRCQILIINGVADSFCLGLDLKQLVGPRKKLSTTEIAIAIKELFEELSDFHKPVAAVVNGPAMGLGMTLLHHVDLAIASDKATFCMPYSLLGCMPEGGATLTLPQIVGSTVAMDLILRGRILTAREACNIGLISEVFEPRLLPHELVSRVRSLAESSFCALNTTKALLKVQLHANLRLVLENEAKLLPRIWLTRTCQDSLRKALENGIFFN